MNTTNTSSDGQFGPFSVMQRLPGGPEEGLYLVEDAQNNPLFAKRAAKSEAARNSNNLAVRDCATTRAFW